MKLLACDSGHLPASVFERLYNVQSYTVFPLGGHFPAWEAPELYANDLRKIALAAG